MRFKQFFIIAAIMLCCQGCGNTGKNDVSSSAAAKALREELYALVDTVPGTVGIAFVSDDDTVTVNNGVHFPMMSVYKVHQAMAAAHAVEISGNALDSMIFVSDAELDRDTWSPMLNEKRYASGNFNIPISELIRYAITQSDNNASNLLFERIISPRETDEFIKSTTEDTTFQIYNSEAEIKANPTLCYLNYTSPLSAALFMRGIFGQQLVRKEFQDSIKYYLSIVTTGQDRLGAVADDSGINVFAHKTGSGFRNEAGELMAHNDVGYFGLKDGRSYSLAVFIRDFSGNEEEASTVIANISKCVYRHFKNSNVK